MKTTELIQKLTRLVLEHGDLPLSHHNYGPMDFTSVRLHEGAFMLVWEPNIPDLTVKARVSLEAAGDKFHVIYRTQDAAYRSPAFNSEHLAISIHDVLGGMILRNAVIDAEEDLPEWKKLQL